MIKKIIISTSFLLQICIAEAVNVPQVSKGPIIDGDLNDKSWKSAAVIDNWQVARGKGKVSDSHRAFVMADGGWLYIGFKISHPHPDKIKPEVTERDGRVQGENCVKVAFDPGTGGKLWYHFRLSAGNVQADQRNSKTGGYDLSWNLPWRSATKITSDGWQAELAFPFCAILDAGDPLKAKLNLLIYSFIPEENGVRKEIYSWAKVGPRWWMRPDKFVKISGLDKIDFTAAFLPFISETHLSNYNQENGKTGYDVRAKIRARSGKSGKIKVVLCEKTASGKINTVEKPVQLPGNTAVDIKLQMPVTAMEKRIVTLKLLDADTGEVRQTRNLDAGNLSRIFTAYLDRNYYTSELFALAICRYTLPKEQLKKLRLEAFIKNKMISSSRQLLPNSGLQIPFRMISDGTYQLKLQLKDKENRILAEQELTLIKRPPNPGHEVKVDHKHLVLLKNGKAFFPFGMLVPRDDVKASPKYQKAGFNSFIRFGGGKMKSLEKTMKTADASKLQAIVWPDRYLTKALLPDARKILPPAMFNAAKKFLKFDAEKQMLLGNHKDILQLYKKMPQLTRDQISKLYFEAVKQNLPDAIKAINMVKNSPDLLAYFIFDEPMIPRVDQSEAGRLLHRTYNRIDGYHPSMTNYNARIPDVDFATSYADIICVDAYWEPNGPEKSGTPNFVARMMALLHERAIRERKVPWIIVKSERISGTWKRSLLPKEQRAQTYLAIIQGNKGIFYFLHPVFHREMFKTLEKLAGEIKSMAPAILLGDNSPRAISYASGKYNRKKGVLPAVQVRLFSNPYMNQLLLVCANSKNYPVDVTFKSELWKGCTSIQRKFGEKNYKISDCKFSDRFNAYDTRVYCFKYLAPWKPAKIKISMTPHPELKRNEAPDPERFTSGRKNLIANPSFEQETFPDWPDYFRAYGIELASSGRTHILDKKVAWNGQKSLKIVVEDNQCRGMFFDAGYKYGPDPYHGNPNTPFVFSAYMKTDRPGVKIWMGKRGNYHQVTLTKDWRRYSCQVKLPARLWIFANMHRKRGGSIWIDGLQLEKGTEPTPFKVENP